MFFVVVDFFGGGEELLHRGFWASGRFLRRRYVLYIYIYSLRCTTADWRILCGRGRAEGETDSNEARKGNTQKVKKEKREERERERERKEAKRLQIDVFIVQKCGREKKKESVIAERFENAFVRRAPVTHSKLRRRNIRGIMKPPGEVGGSISPPYFRSGCYRGICFIFFSSLFLMVALLLPLRSSRTFMTRIEVVALSDVAY